MTNATTRFFESLEARGHEPRLEKVRASLRFDLENGKKRNRWHVAVDKGAIAVSHKNAHADCIVRADSSVFDGIASGEVKPVERPPVPQGTSRRNRRRGGRARCGITVRSCGGVGVRPARVPVRGRPLGLTHAERRLYPAASAAAMRALLAAVSSSTTIWMPAAIGTPMIAPMSPKSAPNARTLASTVKPEIRAAFPMIVGCRM